MSAVGRDAFGEWWRELELGEMVFAIVIQRWETRYPNNRCAIVYQ